MSIENIFDLLGNNSVSNSIVQSKQGKDRLISIDLTGNFGSIIKVYQRRVNG